MTYKPRTPPKVKLPSSARWMSVIRINPDIEIWFSVLKLEERPYAIYPVFCRLKNESPIAAYMPPASSELLATDNRTFDIPGSRFFWSKADLTLVIQHLNTFEYSERTEVSQILFQGSNFNFLEARKDENILALPNSKFVEVFPEMNPDYFRA